MTSPNPKVTVLISTYNRPDYLKDAIGSVVDQAMTNWELLVMNDGGVDVGSIVESFNDSRIQYFHREKNQGKAVCCNFGLEQARGEYIAYIDDDDRWYPCHLDLLSEALDKNPGDDVAYS
ncbi:MAG: glycosyltransferase family 2 protein, partial [Deltaproteobacteria bacterium]